jgi:hypothetical protein
MQSMYRKYAICAAVIWSASFIVFAAVYFFVLKPQHRDLLKLNEDLAVKEFQLNYAVQSDSNEVKTKLYSDLGRLGIDLRTYTQDPRQAGKVVFDIGQIADTLKLKEFACRSKENPKSALGKTDRLSSMSLDINFKGTFNQFAKFINTLERHRPVYFIDNFNISRSTQDSRENESSMVLKLFVCKDMPAVPGVPEIQIPEFVPEVTATVASNLTK